MSTKVRFGVLGAARIAPAALVAPAKSVEEAEVVALAARDPKRAYAFAKKHGIETVAASYEELLADPAIDAIYNPLPNSLHATWTTRALEAKKHVLCEKPFTSNEREAQEVAAVAARSGRVVMEAFHWRYHPLAERMRAIVASGELGRIRRIETALCFPLPFFSDIRYRLDLSGGATMDAGCYAVHMLRHLAGDEPTVEHATARLASPGVDRFMRAEVAFADGRTGEITCSMWSSTLLRMRARVIGDDGTMDVLNPIAPQFFHRIKVKTRSGTRKERASRVPSYTYQLRAFVDAVLRGSPFPTGVDDAIKNMRVIDAIYRKAGLEPRGDKT
jgi:predicted dehydrogenase